MIGMEVWMGIVLAVIGTTALAKCSMIVMSNRNQTRTTATRENSQREYVERNNTVITRPDIQETGIMVYFANDRYGNGDKEYQFNYKNVNGEWRAYILRMPSLRNRNSSGVITHRLYDDNGSPYVCWDRAVTSLKDMQTISKVWADSIQEYIATGKKFG